jgi:hypothetical protein
VDVRLEEDSHVVEELWWVFEFAAGHALLWHIVGDNGAAPQLALSSSPRWWWCSVELRAFVCVGCTLRCVMYECFFFLYDMITLLPLIFFKKNCQHSFSCLPGSNCRTILSDFAVIFVYADL